MHMHTFVHMHTRLVMHMHTFVHMHTRLVMHMHTFVHVHTRLVHAHAYICTHAHEASTCTCMHLYTRTRG